MRVECLIVDSTQPVSPGGEMFEGDSIYIEGDYESVKSALTDLLEQLAGLEEIHKGQLEKDKTRFRECPKCKRWADPRWDEHGDGQGNTCQF